MINNVHALLQLLVLLGCALLQACSDGGSGPSGGGIDGSGLVNFYVTDAPVDEALNVVVTFTQIDLVNKDGKVFEFPLAEARQIDLLALQGENSALLLGDIELPEDEYIKIFLYIQAKDDGVYDSYMTSMDGQQRELELKNKDRLTILQKISVTSNSHVSFTMDFDLRKSLVDSTGTGAVTLKPVVHLIKNDKAGHLYGTISAEWFEENCEVGNTVIYLFNRDLVLEQRLPENAISSSMVSYKNNAYQYVMAYLDAGQYAVVTACTSPENIINPQGVKGDILAGKKLQLPIN